MTTPPEHGRRIEASVGDTETRPQGLVERQETLTRYLLRAQRKRRRKFLLRAQTSSLRKELARNAYLVGCILFDGLVIPEIILVMPSPWGFVTATGAFIAAIYVEWRAYRIFFSLLEGSQEPVDERT